MKGADEGGRATPPSASSLATVAYLCPACGWSVRYPLDDADMRNNRATPLWTGCIHCGGYAFLAGVQPGGGVFDNYTVAEDAEAFRALGIRWEDA